MSHIVKASFLFGEQTQKNYIISNFLDIILCVWGMRKLIKRILENMIFIS